MKIQRIAVTVGQRVSGGNLPAYNTLNVETTIEALIDESDDPTSAHLQLWQMAEQQAHAEIATLLAQGGLTATQNSRAAAPATPQVVERPASEKQREYIDTLVDKLGWTHERLAAYCTEREWDILTLTSREASLLIDALKAMSSDPSLTIDMLKTLSLYTYPLDDRATPRQVRALERLAEDRGIDLAAELAASYGGRSLDALTLDEAGHLLTEWQARPRQFRPRSAADDMEY